jgi:hypothetical protein
VCRQNRSRKYLPTQFKNGFAYYSALRLSPGDRAEGVDGNNDAYNTRIPVSLHRAGRVGLLQAADRFMKFAGAILVVLADTVLKE